MKAYISQNKNKLARFINSEGSFQVHDLVHDFWERYHEAAHARSFSMVVQTCRQKSQQTRHTKKLCTRIFKIHEQVHPYRRKEFQNILKRKLSSCFGQLFSNTYLLRKCWTWNQTWYWHKFDSLLVCNIIRFLFIWSWGKHISYELGGFRILGSTGIEVLALNGIGYCENNFASCRELFVMYFSVNSTRNKKPFL